ncbi:MarR family winged helix-turn-helix transcriptional regulator [Actinokineospora diospyrosa]|uniref:Transcriptional regulator, MarR family n=1 Tax=Actinokineospora diospyrosa TaxID=103728 RepID=A0ABT1IE24_9PSEU|nr:MarR family transcriptional regulator [Actinokineospora diospyrosa]MCP2270895.1 transcriptional regulator, MarR family [Actinokineospora diospyrosa]
MSDAATPVSGLVWRLSTRWRAMIDRVVTPLGLTHAQYAVVAPLSSLQRAGTRPSQRQLADFTGLEPLYVSKLARSLEQAGLVTRTPDPADSRAMLLSLTDRGREVTDQAITAVVALQDQLTASLGGVDSPRTQALIDALRTLLNDPQLEDPQEET